MLTAQNLPVGVLIPPAVEIVAAKARYTALMKRALEALAEAERELAAGRFTSAAISYARAIRVARRAGATARTLIAVKAIAIPAREATDAATRAVGYARRAKMSVDRLDQGTALKEAAEAKKAMEAGLAAIERILPAPVAPPVPVLPIALGLGLLGLLLLR